ncbi:DUF1538 domain-containing protein [Enterococcus durans]|uniref:DUF1538 domain-containing protein n=1 Tax=Enterococcus durans TaxID=53345 RepID=UPI00187F2A26|nr:DUF1538 domain-containing protein [Enterococcus durans]MBC9704031.1 DUF1538 domain-containing protein [Enterococcus sp.]MBE8848728.1 DUF1538 domain-containing protein [Enterococcus durans]MDB1652374.1 DUF1538 domain-containing protein [Enterococcus durans]MDB1656578.1 DUF1538 domain-containing protein [Enterococcus durans]MDB1662800.1 DUF1538 domain-containing protein [Enterococcus durans]
MSTIQQLFAGIEVILYEVVLAVLPIVLLFILLNFFSFRIRRKRFWNILKGFLITTIGLVLFLHGVNMAYVPVGQHLGSAIAAIEHNHLLIPLGFIMGFLVGFAEPAIHVMVKQVEELSEGRIRAKVMLAVISIGIGLAVGLSMWRLLAGFSLYYFLIPGYGLAFILGRKVDKLFLAMAFDNGGVATGPMCSTFLLSMCVSIAAQIEGRDPIIDGFGVVAMIALTPILSTLVLGYIYKRKDEKDQKEKLKLQQLEETR